MVRSLLFSSITFLYYFLPAVLVIYYLTPAKVKNLILFLASFIFYLWGEPKYSVLLLFSVTVGYMGGRCIEYQRQKKCVSAADPADRSGKYKGGYDRLVVGIFTAMTLGLLVFFKYMDFLADSVNRILGTHVPMVQIALPVGISFYTFQIMAYVIDVYRGRIPAEQSLLRLGTYLTMFPQLISGPITNYADVRVALGRERTIKARQLEEGMKLLIIGLAAKVVIADRIGTLWNSIRMIGFDSISTKLAWMGAFAYSLQLYFDFAGYSMMARGIGKMLGFELPVNFRYPYISKSVTEFWRRWHITLGRWFREYVYIPLGGNRKGKARTFFNLFVVWSLTALWHGANYNFLIWGGILLCCLLVEKLFLLRLLDKSRVIGHLYVLFVVPLSWVAFAVTDLSELGVYMTRLFPFAGHAAGVINHLDYLKYLNDYAPLFLLGVLFATPLPETCYRLIERKWIGRVVLLGIFGLCMYYLAVSANNPFLYFNF